MRWVVQSVLASYADQESEHRGLWQVLEVAEALHPHEQSPQLRLVQKSVDHTVGCADASMGR